MAVWVDYALADFLLFSPSTYWRLFEQLNNAVWPFQHLLLALIAAVSAAAASRWSGAGWAVGICLATCWGLTAQLFFTSYYAPINWAIAWVTPVVWAQVVLLVLLAPGLNYAGRRRTWWLGCALICLAIAYPLVGVLDGRPLVQSEVAGLAPDPTALLSIGLIGLARYGWRRVALSILPSLWLIISAVSLVAMGEETVWLLVAMIIASIIMLIPASRRSDASR